MEEDRELQHTYAVAEETARVREVPSGQYSINYHVIMSRQQLQYYSLQNSGNRRKDQPARIFPEEILLQSFPILNSSEIGNYSLMRSSQKEIGSMMPSRSYSNSNVLPDQRNDWRKNYTATPYSDGYQWRKYGEKKISGSAFPRSYYRCTYREDRGCQASKQVQQQGHSDPPLFLVTFKGEHACCSTTAGISDPHPKQLTLQSFQIKQESSVYHDHYHLHRNCNSHTYSSSNCIPTTISHAAGRSDDMDIRMEDSPPPLALESPCDFDFLHSKNQYDQGTSISNGRSCNETVASSPEPVPPATNQNLTAGEEDFTGSRDGFFHGSQELSSIDEEAKMMEPLAFEFDELETLFRFLN